MSSEDVEHKNLGESDESQLQKGRKIVETSAGESGAQGDDDKGGNEGKVPKMDTEDKEETKTATVDCNEHKNFGESDESHIEREGERGGTSPEENVAQDDDGKGANKCNVSEKNMEENKEKSWLPALAIFLALAVACIAVAIYIGPPDNDMKSDFDVAKVFENGLKKLQSSSFTNQTDRFWKILRSRGLAHLRRKDPSQPLVFLLAAPPAAQEWVDCFAIKLAEKLDPDHKTTLARIDGKKEKENNPDETKKTIDDYLKKKFGAGHRVAVIHHLELFPPPSPLMFHSYCDHQNAPLKLVAIIFTVHMPVEPSPSLSPKEAEGSVEKYLSGEVWAKVDKDAVAGLLINIADNVVLMNGESSGSAKALCS